MVIKTKWCSISRYCAPDIVFIVVLQPLLRNAHLLYYLVVFQFIINFKNSFEIKRIHLFVLINIVIVESYDIRKMRRKKTSKQFRFSGMICCDKSEI